MLTSPKIERKVVIQEVCDTTQMMIHYKECINSTLDGDDSLEMIKYYKEECKKESKFIYCKKVRGVQYYKDGEKYKFIPCVEVEKSIDKKLCN